jgi:hypothetical protein
VTENGFAEPVPASGGARGRRARRPRRGLRALGGALPPASAARSALPVDLGSLNAFPEGQFVLATFLSDPAAGEVSRRAAYVRNNGLLDGRPSFTIISSRCTHVGCPTQPNGPLLSRQQKVERGATGRGRARPDAAQRFRLTLPRQPGRHRGQPHGRPSAARARQVRVLDQQRPRLAREDLQRRQRRRRGRNRKDPAVRPPRRR